ncbi:hypothetical protein M427DRAFT_338040 [Gonapodya prolifera JEL478]|uniref:Secreted protein n=1 Tax=Gonapodya prolifera (strain JEL478) TaxID=1344416 RepID=A0A139ADU5_GONPJ|nr:hypothetical protein M427DRAFT_338040 [Gonapodya prolifera JEL478]|eukprot:KXS14764.1 hypothetical protein M427DRAFT_338040 [Gonapodya prolifera JEL478]
MILLGRLISVFTAGTTGTRASTGFVDRFVVMCGALPRAAVTGTAGIRTGEWWRGRSGVVGVLGESGSRAGDSPRSEARAGDSPRRDAGRPRANDI